MDRYIVVIDTETANSVEQPLPYDFGWAVLDTETGKIIRKFSFVCAEIFFDKELMLKLILRKKFRSIGKKSKKASVKLQVFGKFGQH